MPLIRAGFKSPYPIAIVAWVDLLGYGAQISQANFYPGNPHSKAATSRLSRFHQVAAAHSRRTFPSLVINDGAAFYRDLSLRSNSTTFDFLVRCQKVFEAIQGEERAHNQPGARMVVAAGFRSRGRRASDDPSAGQFASITKRLNDGVITAGEAIREAARMPRRVDVVPQLQANYAFTKAYCAETAGSAGGFAGPRLFVDTILFEPGRVPDGLELGTSFEWSDQKLNISGKFAPILKLENPGLPPPAPPGYRTGLAVASDLSADLEFLTSLREAARKR